MSEAARLKTGLSAFLGDVDIVMETCHHGNDSDEKLVEDATKISMKKALEIDLILQATLDSLNFPDLRSCRLVNKNWSVMSSKIILRRDVTVVMLKFDRKENDFRRSSFTDRMYLEPHTNFRLDPKLTSFNEILSASSSSNHFSVFPCSNFLINGGNLGDPDMQKFLEIFGPKIKTLYLAGEYVYNVGDTTSPSVFRHFLQDQVPHVEELTIGHFSYDWPSSSSSSSENCMPFTLPSLRQLSWKGNPWHSILGLDISATAGVIMRSSPGLCIVTDFSVHHDLDLVLQNGRPDMIQGLGIQLDFFRPLIPTLEKLLGIHSTDNRCTMMMKEKGHQLKLKELAFENRRCSSQMVRIFNEDPLSNEDGLRLLYLLGKLFESCSESLESLNLFSIFSDLPGLSVLPVLKNLKRLQPAHICYRGPHHCEKVFPKHLSPAGSFPNLKILDCSQLACHEDLRWEVQFPNYDFSPENLLPTVTTLEFREFATIVWMEKLKRLCPNFKRVVIQEGSFDLRIGSNLQKPFGPYRVVHNFLRNIFSHWTHLEALDMQVKQLSPIRGHCLDAIFCGISETNCQILWTTTDTDVNCDHLRTEPSICNLSELKSLKISIGPELQQNFSSMVDVYTTNGEAPFLSRLAAIHGFTLIPDLKVRIQFDHNNFRTSPMTQALFTSISPYVNIVHKKIQR